MSDYKPIGVFDSGYGGLTVLRDIVQVLPQYDYLYLGDNARAPYGPRSYNTVYQYTLDCVQWFFKMGCPLIILACNTASAKALRTIQQKALPLIDPAKRVLGVIRPTTEIIGTFSSTGHVGILGTTGTIQSGTYPIEISKFFPDVQVYQEACPIWVPLVENNDFNNTGADYFIEKHINHLMAKSNKIDTILLACTHYPLLKYRIQQFLNDDITIVSQGEIVALSLKQYLINHPELAAHCSCTGKVNFFTTDSASDFEERVTIFYGKAVTALHVDLG